MAGVSQGIKYAAVVVEDNPLLLMDAMDLAEGAGFLVYGARDAGQAMRLMNAHPEIRLLFTDVDMPGSMNGLQLARAVSDGWPPVAIIVASGYRRVQEDELPENGQFFAKPYATGSMSKALETVARKLAA
ncbi:MAG TPA: response regulator [Aurantimonas sp.]|uniref:Response regulator n=1 Tax=Aurantimonas marianensis TaxID=2920428 RepID=A0A9X2KHX1_9HYPH|nr:response regulator [Aurantimonas marianensis]MCP3055032.1 response regulator [Aurantimonas marianensis]